MPTPVHTIYVLKVVSDLRCHIDTKEETTPTRRVFTKFTKVSPDPCHLTIQKFGPGLCLTLFTITK